MKKLIQWGVKALIAGIGAVMILSVFCIFYTNDGIHVASDTGATDYVWESGQLKSTMKEGFSWIRMDSYGYNNVFDYSKEPDILLMGSSHMEAAQISKKENVGYLLNTLLPDYHTYNIGVSGHTIYRCMDNLENALETYQPQKYVVMVVDTVELEHDLMMEVIEETATPIPSYDSGFIYYLQKIPAIKVIYKQLDDWISMDGWANSLISHAKEKKDELKYQNTLSVFLRDAASLAEEADLTLMIVYQPEQMLKTDGTLSYGYSETMLQSFRMECEKQGIVFCDMTEGFQTLYEEEHILAHGFANSELGEGHLNKYGHAVIAETIVAKIQELEAE